ncbi:MAG: RdgB/HAM1 family non-canonical purine NTP pyrophosphatase [Lachnospiraceae bacterium]|nr:RdgB/HAM1 family non-canonical purine NTP pyrophosphatase [Lachnospiraceae bacterium]
MSKRIIFATGNKDKLREIREIMTDEWEIISMKEAQIDCEIVENGTSFEENSLIKAKAVWDAAQKKGLRALVLADDSGLEIDFLNGEPGIYSARYLGEDTSYHEKNNSILKRLSGVEEEKRTARFKCAVSAIFPDGSYSQALGVMEGFIGYEEKGENGFGYDPIFILPKYGLSTAELDPEIKNEHSHRGSALRQIRQRILEWDVRNGFGRSEV